MCWTFLFLYISREGNPPRTHPLAASSSICFLGSTVSFFKSLWSGNFSKSEYDETHEESINKNVKNFVLENNKDNKDIGKIFKDVGNNIEFESSMRQFHMNPSTTIPNDQNDFLKYCYGDLPSEKSVTVY